MTDRPTMAMAGIAGAVGLAATVAPKAFLRAFGIPGEEVTGTAAFGWRLFAVRNAWFTVQALRGDESARSAYLPIQLLDQAVFWHAFATGGVPRRAAVQAALASGAVIALDVARRRG